MDLVNTDWKRILGIDYGSKRIGLALSDPMGIIAQAFETLPNDKTFLQKLKGVIRKEEVALIVVGMPFNLKGERAQKSVEVEEFIASLRDSLDTEIVEWDERFTSTMAQRVIREMGHGKEARSDKGKIDAMAAAIMLQSFLDRTKKSLGC